MEITTQEELFAIVMDSLKKMTLGDITSQESLSESKQKEIIEKFMSLSINLCSNILAYTLNVLVIEKKEYQEMLIDYIVEILEENIKQYVKEAKEKTQKSSSNIH